MIKLEFPVWMITIVCVMIIARLWIQYLSDKSQQDFNDNIIKMQKIDQKFHYDLTMEQLKFKESIIEILNNKGESNVRR